MGKDSNRWLIHEMTVDDKPQIIQLFADVFKQPMSGALWEWKYGDGRGAAIVAKRGGRIVAHYGGTRRDILKHGTARVSIQCVDTMVAPREHGTLTRKGPYYQVAQAFLDRYVGYGRPYEIAFGFPNKRVMKLGERVGIQVSVDEIVEPVWLPDSSRRCSDRKYNPAYPADVRIADRLWTEMAGKLGQSILGVRSPEYLDYRYFKNPQYTYDVVFVLSAYLQRVLGLLVFRQDGSRILLLDLVGNTINFPSLINHARYIAHCRGCVDVYAWVSESHLSLLDADSCRIDRPEVQIPTCVCTDGPEPDQLRNRWWLMTGDAEFK